MRPKTLKKKRQKYNFFYGSILTISSIILLTAFLLKALFADPQTHLFSEVLDGIIFETFAFVGATIAGAALVALIVDHHQQKLGDENDFLKMVVQTEGILNVFQDANDPQLSLRITEAIESAHKNFFAFGLGLGVLFNNRRLLQVLADRLNDTPGMRATILTARSDNPGVQNRVSEEHRWHKNSKINYNINWANTYHEEIKSSIFSWLTDGAKTRTQVNTFNTCFMFGAIVIDDVAFVFPYGSPDIRGSESPWYELVYRENEEGYLAKFIRRSVRYYEVNNEDT